MSIVVGPRETTETLTPLQTGNYTTQVTPEMLAGPEVRNLERLGKTAEQITDFVISWQNNKDLQAVTQVENKMKEVIMRRTLAANERRGAEAAGLLGEEEKFFDSNFYQSDKEAPIEEVVQYHNLYNGLDERQKKAADVLRARQKTTYLKTIGGHEQQQMRESTINTANDSITLDIAAASLNPYDEETRLERIASIRTHAESIQSAKGWTAQERELKEKTAISSIHENTIKGFIANKDVASAEDYLKKFRDEITGDVSNMEKTIANRGADLLSEKLADAAFKTWKIDPFEANEMIDAITDPDVQAKARAEFDASVRAQEAADTQNLKRAHKIINEQIYRAKEPVTKFSDLDQEALNVILNQADGATRLEGIQNNLKNQAKFEEPTTDVQIDTFNTVSSLLKTKQGRDIFKKMDINGFLPKLGSKYTEYFITKQVALENEQAGTGVKKEEILAAREQLVLLDQKGYELIKVKMHQTLIEKEIAKEKELGRPLTPDEYNDLVKETHTFDTVRQYKAMKGNFDFYGTLKAEQLKLQDAALARQDKARGRLPKDLQAAPAQIKGYLDALEETDFKHGGLKDDEAKEQITQRLLGRIDRAQQKSGKTFNWSRRQRLMEFEMQQNKVSISNYLRDDHNVPMIMIAPKNYGDVYVTDPGGGKVMISSIDALGEEEKKKVEKHLDAKPKPEDRVYSYENYATALFEIGNKNIAVKIKQARERRSLIRLERMSGTFEYKGKKYDRRGIYERILRVGPSIDVERLRIRLSTLYGDEGLRIGDIAVKELRDK